MVKTEDQETGETEDFLKGFLFKPVFRVEDTGGEPLGFEQIELPDLPLIEKSEKWGISVKAVPGNYRYYGYYSSGRKEIALATPEKSVFFHELAHVAHEKVNGSLKSGQDPIQEIIAKLSTAALFRMVGKKQENGLGNSFRYIQRYASELDLAVHNACLKVMSKTVKVLNTIISDCSEPD